MAISDTINSIITNVSNAYDEIDNKGGTLPANKNIENLADAIATITGGTPTPPEPTPTSMSYFEANGTELTKYTGTLSEVVVPKSYNKTENIIATVTGALVNPDRTKTGIINTSTQVLNLQFTDGTTTMTAQIDSSHINSMENLETFFTTNFSITPVLVSATPSGSAFFQPYAMGTLLDMCQQYNFLSFPINVYDTYNYQSQTFNTVEDMYYYINSHNNSNLAFTFTDTTVLKEVTFSDGNDYQITSIGNDVFKSNTSLTKVTILSNITTIGLRAFEYCSNLQEVMMYDGVTTLSDSGDDYGIFRECSKLGKITLSNNITTIPRGCFYGCYPLKEIELPTSLTTINATAFYNCRSLASITIPKTVTSLGGSIFGQCYSLSQIVVDSENTTFDSRNNCNCIIQKSNNQLLYGSSLATIPNTVTSIGANAFDQRKGLTSITIPSSVTSIGQYAFNNTSLASITIPNSVTSIGNYAFQNCKYMTQVTFSSGSSALTLGNGVFYGTNLASVTIPSRVSSIGTNCFDSCKSLATVTISANISGAIPNYLFQNCSALKSVTIPSNATSIGSYAFNGCTSLTAISIPSNVTTINSNAYNGCVNLVTVDIPSTVTDIKANAFKGCTKLQTANIYATSSTTKISSYSNAWFNNCSSSLVLHIPSSVTAPTTAYGTYWNYYGSGSTLTYYADL